MNLKFVSVPVFGATKYYFILYNKTSLFPTKIIQDYQDPFRNVIKKIKKNSKERNSLAKGNLIHM